MFILALIMAWQELLPKHEKYGQITSIYGALRGVEGVINEDFIDLTQETSFKCNQVAETPSSALFSTRVKLMLLAKDF